jgi:hypothetical protein
MTPHIILLYGRSLLLSLVAASLAHYPDLQVVQASTWEKAGQWLDKGEPDVLIFDLVDGCENHILPLLLNHPDLLLIGVSPESNRVMLWSGRQLRQASIQDLVQVIKLKESNSASFERKEK